MATQTGGDAPELRNRVALVIGGAAGIGLASARALAAKGATVVIADRDGDAAQRGADAVRASGGEAVAYAVDASSMSQLRALLDFVGKTYGRLNVLFSNAGSRGADGFDVSEAEFDEAFAINVKSHFFATTYALPLLLPCAPHASVIYTASAGALKLGGRSPLYSISKSSILMMARAFARELGPARIRVNALCPGAIETGFPRWSTLDEADYKATVERIGRGLPLGRIGQPEDVAGVVAFLASDQSMFVTGLAIPIDGGELA
jgi:NAD(P)-dependent dehydrogenase (short-subunit alcohol dehydrogenase family)